MSFEVFEKLEAKVQQAIDTITLLQMSSTYGRNVCAHCWEKWKRFEASADVKNGCSGTRFHVCFPLLSDLIRGPAHLLTE